MDVECVDDIERYKQELDRLNLELEAIDTEVRFPLRFLVALIHSPDRSTSPVTVEQGAGRGRVPSQRSGQVPDLHREDHRQEGCSWYRSGSDEGWSD